MASKTVDARRLGKLVREGEIAGSWPRGLQISAARDGYGRWKYTAALGCLSVWGYSLGAALNQLMEQK